jgi:hypothetical protein
MNYVTSTSTDSRLFVNLLRTKICARARSEPLRGCLLKAHCHIAFKDGVSDTADDALAGDVGVLNRPTVQYAGEADGTYAVAQSYLTSYDC